MNYIFTPGKQLGFLALDKSYVLKKLNKTQPGTIKKLPTEGPIIPGVGMPMVHVEYKLGSENVTMFCSYFDRVLPGGWLLTDEEWS